MTETEMFLHLAVALSVGLLIGLERGWKDREAPEGFRIAGVRTFALISVLGALWALLAEELGPVLLGFGFSAVAIIIIAAYSLTALRNTEYGITTAIAAMITFALGAAAMRGYINFVAAVAVLTAMILGVKSILHKWIQYIDQKELYAIFQMLIISVVLLPVLPDQGYGPWNALNPYQIWWMVVLIAAISFSGYFATKILGPRQGLGLVGLFGGLVSSTAVTLNFSKLGRDSPELNKVLSSGILIAAGTMFPRTLFLTWLIYAPLVKELLLPLGVMMAACFLGAGLLWRNNDVTAEPHQYIKNPFELKTALQFGALLAVIMLLATALHHWYGDAGIYMLAGISGIIDIDAVTLSVSTMAGKELDSTVAAYAIMIAAIVNTLIKGLLAITIAGGQMARDIGIVLTLVILCGIAMAMLTGNFI